MKKFILLLIAVVAATYVFPTTAAEKYDEGYVFIAPLKAHAKKSLKSRVKSTIDIGRVAVKSSTNPGELTLSCIDVAEYFIVKNGSFYEYYPPAQDYVPAQYVSVAEFQKATRKVKIYADVPASLENGKRYTFVSKGPDEYRATVTVRAIRLTAPGVTLVTEVDYDNNWAPLKTIDISGKTILEVTFNDDPIYIYGNEQVMLASNTAGGDYSTLVVDGDGVTYAKSGDNRRADTKLSHVFGEIPEIGYVGWISDTELVIDDSLYTLSTK